MQKTIGKCSICGGAVQVPMAYFGIPPATCSSCGAIKANDLPVISMEKKPIFNTNKSPDFNSSKFYLKT